MPCIFHRQKLKSQSISNFFYFQIILLRIYCHVILSTQVNINLTAVNVLAMKWHALTIERKDQCVSLVEDAKQSCLLWPTSKQQQALVLCPTWPSTLSWPRTAEPWPLRAIETHNHMQAGHSFGDIGHDAECVMRKNQVTVDMTRCPRTRNLLHHTALAELAVMTIEQLEGQSHCHYIGQARNLCPSGSWTLS